VCAVGPDATVGEVAALFLTRRCPCITVPLPGAATPALIDPLTLLRWVMARAPAGFNSKTLSEFFADVTQTPAAEAVRPPTAAAGGPKAAAGRRPNATAEQAACPTATARLRGLQREMEAGHLRMLAHLPAELLSAVGSPVATVKGSDTLFAALHHLCAAASGGCEAAVVDTGTGMFVGCLSAADLGLVLSGRVSPMARVADFMREHGGPACVCTASTPLQELAADLLATGRQTAVLVDSYYAPVLGFSAAAIVAAVFPADADPPTRTA